MYVSRKVYIYTHIVYIDIYIYARSIEACSPVLHGSD